MVRGRKTLMKDIYIEEGVFINYSKPLMRGGNSKTKKDLDKKIKELKKEGWMVTFGKWGKGENEYFDYWYEGYKYEKIGENECPRCKAEYHCRILTEKEEKENELPENLLIRYCLDCGNIFIKEKRSVA